MKYLVTGVAGFIGSHLMAALLKRGHYVVGLDNFLTGKEENIEDVLSMDPSYAQHFRFIRGDIRKADDCCQAMEGVDFVFHEAAIGSVPWSIEDPLLAHETNVTGFLNILQAARKHRVKRVVYASSSAVYGDITEVPNREERLGACLSPYASTKLCNEVYAASFARSYGMELVGLRYFNVFGPRQDPAGAYAAVIPKWRECMEAGRACVIYGDGLTTRDFCYVDNVVEANLLASSVELKELAPVYNIAAGRETSLNALHEIMALKVGEQRKRKIEAPIYKEERLGDIKYSRADIEKASRDLGYLPKVPVSEGIQCYFLNPR